MLLLDQAGWHTSDKLLVPANISLLPLPPKSLIDQPWTIMSIGLRDWAHA